MNKVLWFLLIPFLASCGEEKEKKTIPSDNPEKDETFHAPEGYGGGNDSTE
jgi:hypothetical protein